MTTMLALSRQNRLWVLSWLAVCFMAATLPAQTPAPRLLTEINRNVPSVLSGSRHPLARPEFDAGRLPADMRLAGITIHFSRSPRQEADLQALTQAQQDPRSPQYHQWLDPDQFAARFGMAQADLEKVQAWLEQEGFTVEGANRSHNAIRFSGTIRQVEQAFSTEMHYYNLSGQRHFAPSTELSVPAAVAPVIVAIRNLDDIRPRPRQIPGSRRAKPSYTFVDQNNNQDVLFAPGDIKIAYDINALASGGDTGTGQTIAIAGQSEIQLSDVTNFQDASGLAEKAPATTLVPNSGNPALFQGDEGESDLDVEWSGAIAPGATINFIYTGDSPNFGVFDSLEYAIDNKIGDIVSISYGSCELEVGQSNFQAEEQVLAQADAQGQTIVASSGDSGATGCYGFTDLPANEQDALAVDYPASSVHVTGVGGTAISAADDVVGTYWSSAGSSSSGILVTSATQYIPEVAWNDDSLSAVSGCTQSMDCVSAGGGGISSLAAQPSWQSGYFSATGAKNPSSSFRLVPDVALYSSSAVPGYLYCSSDQSDWDTADGQTGSCGDGQFYDPNSEFFTIAGGTSFAAPIFAGMTAILNQAKSYTGGQGLINPELYTLAATSANSSPASSGQGSAAFHDVTTGNNECTQGSTVCPAAGGYSAGAGYDLVTGLGSVDLKNLVGVWAQNASAVVGTVTTISGNASPAVNAADTFTVTVSPVAGSAVPAGTVNVTIDGGTPKSYTLTASGSAATATFSGTFTATGTHTVLATYEPADATVFDSSTGTLSVSVAVVSSGKGTFSLSASSVTLSQGAQGSTTVTVTPAGGYTGTVQLSIASTTACFGTATAVVGGTSAVTATLPVDTNLADCQGTGLALSGARGIGRLSRSSTPARPAAPAAPAMGLAATGLAGVLLAGLAGWRLRRARLFAAMLVLGSLGSLGLALSGCGGGGGSNGNNFTPKGTYTITVAGQDSSTSTISASSTFTLTVQPFTVTVQ